MPEAYSLETSCFHPLLLFVARVEFVDERVFKRAASERFLMHRSERYHTASTLCAVILIVVWG